MASSTGGIGETPESKHVNHESSISIDKEMESTTKPASMSTYLVI